MPGTLGTTQNEGVLVLELRNPDKRNALDPPLCEALAAALGAPGRARAIVLTGAGERAFSAGFDLEALPAPGEPLPRDPFEGLLDAVSACAVPIVAALRGVAMGGGLELAAACDLRVGHAELKLAMPPARLGIVYSPRGLERFSALCGESRARRLFLTACTIDGHEAHRIGLCDELVPADEVLARASALGAEVAALAPLAVQGMRRTFEALGRARLRALDPVDAAALADLRAASFASADHAEARRAFSEKRSPRFEGQ